MHTFTKAPTTIGVSRLRFQGKDALYVTASDGSDLGWYNLESDLGHPHSELFSLVVDAAAAGWRRGSGSPLLSGASALVDVVRWNRDGIDSLLVYGYDGTELGTYDLRTDTAHPGSEIMLLPVQAAGLAYKVGVRSAPRDAERRPNLHLTRVTGESTDKLFVTAYDGTDLGWYDLLADSAHPASEIMQLVVEAAGLGWRAAHKEHAEVAPLPLPSSLLEAHLQALKATDDRWFFARYPVELDGTCMDVHLVIGPAGGFLLCSKDFSHDEVSVADETLLVNGIGSLCLKAGIRMANQLTAHLSAAAHAPITVRPVIACFGATMLPQQAVGGDEVIVLSGDCVPQWLRARREVVDDESLQALAAQAGAIGRTLLGGDAKLVAPPY